MSKYNIRPSSKVKIGLRMSIYDIPPDFECENRILNVKLRYSAQVRMSKKDYECYNTIFSLNSNVKIGFWLDCIDSWSLQPYLLWKECQNAIYGPFSNVKIGFWMLKYDIQPQFECQNRILNANCDIRPQFKCQNRILNVKIRYSAVFRMSK